MATWRLLRAFFPLLVTAATRWFWDNATSFLQEITFPSHSANPLWSPWEYNFSASPLLSSLPLSYLQRARGPELVTFQGESIIPCWEVRGSLRWYKLADSKFQLTHGCLQCDCDHTVIPPNYLWSQSHSFSLLLRFHVLWSNKRSSYLSQIPLETKTRWSFFTNLASSQVLISYPSSSFGPQHDYSYI